MIKNGSCYLFNRLDMEWRSQLYGRDLHSTFASLLPFVTSFLRDEPRINTLSENNNGNFSLSVDVLQATSVRPDA